MRKNRGIERRRTQRLDIPIPVRYRLSWNRKDFSEQVLTKNISGGGMCLSLKQPLKAGTKLKMSLYFPSDPVPIESLSEVAWCRRNPLKKKTLFDVGIRHLKIIPKDRERFVFLFCETMVNYFLLPLKISLSGKCKAA